MPAAAKDRTIEVFPLAAAALFVQNSRPGIEPGNSRSHRASSSASSTLHWASTPVYDGTASGKPDQRYYHRGWGRFMSADPYLASGGTADPGSWNRYAYVEGDPINSNDPRGLEQCTWTGGAVATLNCQEDTWDIFRVVSRAAPAPREIDLQLLQLAPLGIPPGALPYVVGEALRAEVKAGNMNDCQAMANFANEVAERSFGDVSRFVSSFGILTPFSPGLGSAIGIAGSSSAVSLQVSPQTSGYASQYRNQDPAGIQADQGHHFAMLFQIGYRYNEAIGTLVNTVHEVLSALRGGYDVNAGDILLGNYAAQLGRSLREGRISSYEIGYRISDDLCAK